MIVANENENGIKTKTVVIEQIKIANSCQKQNNQFEMRKTFNLLAGK